MDLRKEKQLKLSKLDKKAIKKFKDADELMNLLLEYKATYYSQTGKKKLIKKAKLDKNMELQLAEIFVNRAKQQKRMLVHFWTSKEGVLNISSSEVFWAITNSITGEQPMYKSKKPYTSITEHDFYNNIVWQVRYALEMIYDDDKDLSYWIKNAHDYAKDMFAENSVPFTALESEKMAVTFMEKYLGEVIGID